MATKRRRKKLPLKGKISSGLIFIGDPSYLSGPSNMALNELGEVTNTIPLDPYNPFRREEDVLDKVRISGDTELEIIPHLTGRGTVLVTNGIQEGSFEVKKKYDKISGKLLEIKLIIKG